MKTNDTWVSPFAVPAGTVSAAKAYDGCLTLAASGAPPEARYRCLRTGVGLTDTSHFGKFRFSGPAALEAVNRLVLSDVARLPVRRMMSTFVLREDGKALADAYVVNDGSAYTLFTEGVLPATIAAACAPAEAGVSVTDLTRQLALLSLDGPFAWELLKDLVGVSILGARYLDVVTGMSIAGVATTIYRAGKTGEFGYLLELDGVHAAQVLEAIAAAGSKYQMLVCDQDDVDLCKLENRVINMQREGAAAASVLELNTRVMVSKDKESYVGQAAIEGALSDPKLPRLIGVRCEVAGEHPDAGPLREGAGIFYRDTCIGKVSNARYSPTLERWIGVALMDPDYAYVGLDYVAENGLAVRTVSAPFITNQSVRVRPQEDSFFAQERV